MQETLATTLVRHHPETAAGVLEQREPSESVAMLAEWPTDVTARVLERMLPHAAGEVFAAMQPDACSALLHDMQEREAVRVLAQLDDTVRERLLGALDPAYAAALGALASYPAETAGGMMEPRVVTLREDLDVGQAIAAIRRAPIGALHYLYVTDREQRLRGVLLMRDMLLADESTPVADIVRTEIVTLPVDCDREQIAETFEAHRFAVLPVVDENHRLLGVVRHDAVIEAARDEAYEDLQRMVGAGGGERALDPVRQVVVKRLPWLVVNLGTAFLAALVVGLFEETIAAVTALAVLLPIVAGQSGNTGAQSMAVVLRGLAMGEVRGGLRRLVLRKELLAGLANGAAIAVVCGIGVWMWDGRPVLGGVIALSMLLAMVLAAVAGAAIPIAIDATGRDPAQSSSIFLTTVTDVVGFGSFLGIAALAGSYLTG
jgi:magnesium transporter